jgi:hypothetical protein
VTEEAVFKRNEAKNKFAHDARAVQLEDIIKQNKATLEEDEGEVEEV